MQVLADEPVTAISVSQGAVTGLATAGRRIETGIVVDAAGAWVRQVGELAGAWVAAALVPAVQTAVQQGAVAEHRGGLFTMSPDGRFLAGPVPEVPGLWVASGCNGSGFSSSPAIR